MAFSVWKCCRAPSPYFSWLNAIPSSTSGSATVSLKTIDTNGNSLGTYTYGFTITAPASVVPSITSVSSSPVNSNSVINGWGFYVYGKSQASIAINGAAGAYGSTIKSYSIDSSKLHSISPECWLLGCPTLHFGNDFSWSYSLFGASKKTAQRRVQSDWVVWDGCRFCP